jgi:NADPH:quinone reductase-like Zn-dependent oxidoreductase
MGGASAPPAPTVRAIGIREFGGRDRLEQLDLPEPKLPPESVLISIRAASVNPVDWKVREGRLEPRFPHVFPVVMGWDAAGVVERVGPAVTEFEEGDEVFAYCRKQFVGEGTYCEYVAVPESSVARKPESVDFEHAAAIPLTGLTAYQALFGAAGLTGSETVLVHAAAGGVGSFAVQLAADIEAEVVGTASATNHEYVLALGATEVVDYREQDFVEAVRDAYPDGVDVVFDIVGGDTLRRSVDVVADGGRIVSIIEPPTGPEFRVRGIEPSYVFVRPTGDELQELADMVDDERLEVHLADVFPLAEAAAAHELSEAGHVRGKIAIQI